MSLRILLAWIALAVMCLTVQAGQPEASKTQPSADFTFADVKYFHRWSENEQHEYTPDGQTDLEHWQDMVTLLRYPKVADAEALAAAANAVLGQYRANRALVVKTSAIPKTAEKEAERFMVVIFGQPTFVEIVFARLKLDHGMGVAIVYSHRIYGDHPADQATAWLKANGPATEMTLLRWDAMPALPAPPASQPRP